MLFVLVTCLSFDLNCASSFHHRSRNLQKQKAIFSSDCMLLFKNLNRIVTLQIVKVTAVSKLKKKKNKTKNYDFLSKLNLFVCLVLFHKNCFARKIMKRTFKKYLLNFCSIICFTFPDSENIFQSLTCLQC